MLNLSGIIFPIFILWELCTCMRWTMTRYTSVSPNTSLSSFPYVLFLRRPLLFSNNPPSPVSCPYVQGYGANPLEHRNLMVATSSVEYYFYNLFLYLRLTLSTHESQFLNTLFLSVDLSITDSYWTHNWENRSTKDVVHLGLVLRQPSANKWMYKDICIMDY